jgi:oligoribonuclease NrnB/cAMP/cGMP phosphodiesterase (DHH superfamily)
MIDDQGFHDSETIYIAAFYGGNERNCAGGHTQSEQMVNVRYSHLTRRMTKALVIEILRPREKRKRK